MSIEALSSSATHASFGYGVLARSLDSQAQAALTLMRSLPQIPRPQPASAGSQLSTWA
jgi:hypothetical protein